MKQGAETPHLATTRHGAASTWAFSSNHFARHSPETSAQLISRLRDLPRIGLLCLESEPQSADNLSFTRSLAALAPRPAPGFIELV